MTNDLLQNIESYRDFLISVKGQTPEEAECTISELKKLMTYKPKKYGLAWEDKEEEIAEELKYSIPYLEEYTELSISKGKEDDPNHLLIEGDNLEALKLLMTTHKEKVNVIYIDPPYNTGNEFIYNDKLVDKKDGYRHSKWLSFMHKRLVLAKELMSEDGVIFISIDDNEFAQLKLLCDEIFGEKNFVSNLIWVNNLKGRQIDKHLANVNEYILCYAKKIEFLSFNKQREMDESILKKYSLHDDISRYKKGVVLYNTNSKFNIETRKNLTYSIYFNPQTGDCVCRDEKILQNGTWVLPEENLLDDSYIKIIPPIRSTNNKRGCWRWSMEKFEKEYKKEIMILKDSNGKYMAHTKDRLTSDGVKLTKYKNMILNISSSTGTTELTNIFRNKPFDYPKPKKLIKTLLEICSNKDSIVLDFFAGSGTTGHAVLELNKEDGGNRQFILCTNNENNICKEITYERLNKVTNGYTTPRGEEVEGVSANLKYYKANKFVKRGYTEEELSLLYIEHSIPLLQIKHNAFSLVSKGSHGWVYESEQMRFGVLDDMATENDFEMIKQSLEEYRGEKTLYLFSTDNVSYPKYKTLASLDEFIKPIPREIIQLLMGVQ